MIIEMAELLERLAKRKRVAPEGGTVDQGVPVGDTRGAC